MYQVKIHLAWYSAVLDGDLFRVDLEAMPNALRCFYLTGEAMARRLREGTAIITGSAA